MNIHDKPLAAAGLTSYRYRGRYGYIMIGAKHHDDALREAQRSFSDKRTVPTLDCLEVWNGSHYEQVTE